MKRWEDQSIEERNADKHIVLAPWMPGKMRPAWVQGFNDDFVFVQYKCDKFVERLPHNAVEEIK